MPAKRALLLSALLSLGVGLSAPDRASADIGSYLAARQAVFSNDFTEMVGYSYRALRDRPDDPQLLETNISALIAVGDVTGARDSAETLIAVEPQNQLAGMTLQLLSAKDGDFAAILDALDNGQGVSPLVDGLVRAWALVGTGEMTEALAAFDEVSAQPGLLAFGLCEKALALAFVGDLESANDILSSGDIPATRRGIIAHAQVLSLLEQFDAARDVLAATFGSELDPELAALDAKLAANEPVPVSIVTSPGEGIGEVYFSVATALDGELEDGYALLYARAAQFLRPEMTDATLLTAAFLERLEAYDLATEAFDLIPRDSLSFPAAELGRANALHEAGREDASIEVLRQLTKSNPDLPAVHVALGDAMRRAENYAAAVKAYDEAIALFPEPNAMQWVLYFTRGISHERLDEWDEAEADFRKALELSPDQPQVLNYMGYSYLEMKVNLDEAMEMIRKAAAARPQDGYIVDSLAWGLYRLGRYDEAVEPMERATALMPTDPIINDHLGDVYWSVGREREARFQWSRALSFEPEEDEADRIRRKLEIGLDKVLVEEGEEPTRPVK